MMKNFLAAILLLFIGCGEDAQNNITADMGTDLSQEDVEPYPTVSFEDEIVPILRNSCLVSGCHGENGMTAFTVEQGLDATPTQIANALRNQKASNGTLLISPNKPSQSEIVKRVLAETGTMPPLADLPNEQLNDLNFWVAQGARY